MQVLTFYLVKFLNASNVEKEDMMKINMTKILCQNELHIIRYKIFNFQDFLHF